MGVWCSPLLLKEELKIMVDSVGNVGSAVGKGWLLDVDAIILDEVHYLSNISRETVWEETVLLKSRRFMVRSQASCRSLCPQLFLKVKVLNGDFDKKIVASGVDRRLYVTLMEPVFEWTMKYIFEGANQVEMAFVIHALGGIVGLR